MSFAKKQIAVVYIDVNKALFYIGYSGAILQLDFPSNVISDLDIVSKEKFEELLGTFIDSNNLKGLGIESILVFSKSSAFEKDFPEDTKGKEEEIQKFIDIIPFEDVLSKTYKFNKKTKVVAINKILYEAIKDAFEKKKISISLTLPFSILQELNVELENKVDLAFIAEKADSLKQYNLASDYENNAQDGQEKKSGSKKQNLRLYIFIGIFVILLVVLIVLIISTSSSKPSTKRGAALPSISPIPTIQKESVQSASPAGVFSASASPTIEPSIPSN